MQQSRPQLAALAAVLIVVALAACTSPGPLPSDPPDAVATTPAPTATPTPTAPPPVAELVLTTEGLGTLVIGEAPAVDVPDAMVWFDPEACVEMGAPAGTPEAGRWSASYPGEVPPFGVGIDEDGVLTRIDVFSDIPTDTGLRRGGSIDQLVAAHPAYATPMLTGPVTAVWVIPGERGQLLVEAMSEDYSGHLAGEIVAITLIETGARPFGKYGSDNAAGGCL